jgi:hypothetical protein
MRASEEDGYKMLRLPRRWENLPGRWEELYVSSFQPDVESWIDGNYCHLKMEQGNGSLAQFKGIGWEFVTRGESTTFRKETLQIEKEYEMMFSSPTINECLRICLSVCRRTYGDYALRDIDIMISKTTYECKDGGNEDKDWDRWLGMGEKSLGANKLTLMFEYRFLSTHLDGLFRHLRLDGSQYRVTIV